jgi:5-formyltetrahydrofolate cyclo-ligase
MPDPEVVVSAESSGPQSEAWDDVRSWRKTSRHALIERRMSLASHVRSARGEQAKARLLEHANLSRFSIGGLYWPIRGEVVVRDLARSLAVTARVALPVVVERGSPVEFWEWRPGMRMTRGLWNIPVPAERTVVLPDALIVPVVGFDSEAYRLGYGGGYYDRTLAAAAPRPFCIGLGYEEFRLTSIHPQAHDIPMDMIVTDKGCVRPARQR